MTGNRDIVLRNANIIEGTAGHVGLGDIVIRDERIAAITTPGASGHELEADNIDCSGLTIMPGLCDAHAHLSWLDSSTFDAIGMLPVEEHMLATARNAATYLDAGFTMCVGAAAAKLRLDVVVRNAINNGAIPGPRYLANGPEISATGSYIDTGPSHRPPFDFGLLADGPEEVRKHVRRLAREGVDLIKLGLSGEEIVGRPRAEAVIFSDEEVAMAVSESARLGIRVCAHARSAGAVRQCLMHGVQIIFHASFIDDESIDELARRRDDFFVVPSLAFIARMVEGAAAPFGLPAEVAAGMGYARELDAAVKACRKMRDAGVRLLPGGDYGFAWTPHGSYARDLQDFVELLGFTPAETIEAATVLGGQIMGAPDELGRVAAGYLADLLIVDGDPLQDIRLLQDADRIVGVMKGGRFHRRPELDQGRRCAA